MSYLYFIDDLSKHTLEYLNALVNSPSGHNAKQLRIAVSWCIYTIGNNIEFDIIWKGLPTMAKNNGWSFVNIRISSAQEKAFEAHCKSLDNDAIGMMNDVLSRGYKVSVRYVVDKTAFVVSVSGTDETKHGQQQTITSWSDDMLEAFAMTHFKLDKVLQWGEWVSDERNENWG